jgi:hypothetical protein
MIVRQEIQTLATLLSCAFGYFWMLFLVTLGRVVSTLQTTTFRCKITILSHKYLQIIITKRMSIIAMGFRCVRGGPRLPAKQICLTSDDLQMRRIDAMAYSAKMVALLLPTWNDFNKKLIEKSMSSLCRKFFTTSKISISTFTNSADPLPTWISFIKVLSRYPYLRKNAGEKFSVYGKSIRLIKRHFANTSVVQNLARAASRLILAVRPVFIITQYQTA